MLLSKYKNPLIMLRHRPIIAILGLFILMACSSTVWDDVPTPIKEFISSYWPGASVSTYDERNGNYYVTIKNGASLVFDSNYQWTSINGNGVPVPSILIFNEMPRVYQYLEARELTSDLMSAENNPRTIILTFTDFILEYNKETSEIKMITQKE